MSISHPRILSSAKAAVVALEGMVATAPSLADWQVSAGSPMGTPGLFLEGLRFFGVYHLMADAAPCLACR